MEQVPPDPPRQVAVADERLLEESTITDDFTASRTLREISSFTRDDGTPSLNYTLFIIKDWFRNTFEVVNHHRINTDDIHDRYDATSNTIG